MTILELQKRLQEAYEKYGDINVSIQNGDNGGEYFGWRNAESTNIEESPDIKIVIW